MLSNRGVVNELLSRNKRPAHRVFMPVLPVAVLLLASSVIVGFGSGVVMAQMPPLFSTPSHADEPSASPSTAATHPSTDPPSNAAPRIHHGDEAPRLGPFSPQEPQSMGLSDLGVTPWQVSYNYSATQFIGNVTINSINTTESGSYPTWSSFQLNVVLYLTKGTTNHSIWIQDVAQFDSRTGAVDFLDNVWALDTYSQLGVYNYGLQNTCPSGSYQITYDTVSRQYFYYCFSSFSQRVGLPSTLTLHVKSTVLNGTPHVQFLYEVHAANGTIYNQTFDDVAFTNFGALWTDHGFTVDGSRLTGSSASYDAEMVWGGVADRLTATVHSPSQIYFSLMYFNGSHFLNTAYAWNYGLDTGEKVTDVAVNSPAGPLITPIRFFYGGSYIWLPINSSATPLSQPGYLHYLWVATTNVLSLSTQSGFPTMNTTAGGNGFSHGTQVSLYIDNVTLSPFGGVNGLYGHGYSIALRGGSCLTNSVGSFSNCWFSIPYMIGGSAWIWATDGRNLSYAGFNVTASVILSATTGKGQSGAQPGRTIDVAGGGYDPAFAVDLHFHGGIHDWPLGSPYGNCTDLQINQTGSLYPCTFSVPTNLPANYTIQAMNHNGLGVMFTFALFIVPHPWLSLTPLSNNQTRLSVEASGGGFVPDSNVYFEYNGSTVTQSNCLTGLQGNFSGCTMQLPYVQRQYSINWTVWAWDKVCSTLIVFPSCKWSAIGTITVGTGPTSLALDPALGRIYVTNSQSGTISVLSNVTGQVLTTITTGSCPTGIAYDSVKGEMFVTYSCSNLVRVIRDSTNLVVATITVGTGPVGIAYDQAQGFLIAANSGSNSVSVINDASNTVARTIAVGSGPTGVAYDTGVQRAYVSNTQGNSVSVVNPLGGNGPLSLISVGQCPKGLSYDARMSEVFVANSCSGTLSIIRDSTNTVVATPTVGGQPTSVAYDADNGAVLVSDYVHNTVIVVNDTWNQIGTTIPTQVGGTSGVIYVGGHGIVVTGTTSNKVSFVFSGDGTSLWFWY